MAKTFDDKSMARVVRATKMVERNRPAPASSGRTPPQYNVIIAKITGSSGTGTARRYAWAQVRATDTGYDATGLTGTTSKGYAVSFRDPACGTNDIVTLARVALDKGDGTYKAVWGIVNLPPPNTVLRCTLTAAGGANGADDGSTGPSYAYLITFNGVTYAGALQPEDRPFATGKVDQPAVLRGTFCVDGDNVLHLITANEQWSTRDDCGTDTGGG